MEVLAGCEPQLNHNLNTTNCFIIRFRWVALQIDSLRRCLKAKEVEDQLKALPKDLEESYERILVRSEKRSDLLQMLRWLAFSARDLQLEELAETVSVDLNAHECPSHNVDLRYPDPDAALTVCSGLVTVAQGTCLKIVLSIRSKWTS